MGATTQPTHWRHWPRATAAGCELAPMLHGLREYRGEPYRVEPVGGMRTSSSTTTQQGTNVGATVAAIQASGADRAPAKLVLILAATARARTSARWPSRVARPAARRL